MRFEGTSAYVATQDLKVAVNAAIALERPLLVKGEPGTGKTVLAIEIAKAATARVFYNTVLALPWEYAEDLDQHALASRVEASISFPREVLGITAGWLYRAIAWD